MSLKRLRSGIFDERQWWDEAEDTLTILGTHARDKKGDAVGTAEDDTKGNEGNKGNAEGNEGNKGKHDGDSEETLYMHGGGDVCEDEGDEGDDDYEGTDKGSEGGKHDGNDEGKHNG